MTDSFRITHENNASIPFPMKSSPRIRPALQFFISEDDVIQNTYGKHILFHLVYSYLTFVPFLPHRSVRVLLSGFSHPAII